MDWRASDSEGFFRPSELTSYDPAAVGLSLSGGGYRATLFHTGAIIRINELGILPKLDRVASVSGGSIAAGLLAKAWTRLDFDPATGIAGNLRAEVVAPALALTARTFDWRVTLGGLLPFVSAGNYLSSLYDRHVFRGLKLRDLPSRPKFIFCATNLQSGGLIRFTRDYIADWRALYCENHQVRLSDAVAASSAFPPVLAPLRLDLSGETVTVPEGARFKDPELRRRPVLVDGGVYDNLGLEPVWKRCGVIIASYAGMNLKSQPGNFVLSHMYPVVNAFLASSIDWRERILIDLYQHRLADGRGERIGSYWTADTDIEAFPARDGWRPTVTKLKKAANLPTRLKALTPAMQRTVINAGYAFADRALRSYLVHGAPPPDRPPEV